MASALRDPENLSELVFETLHVVEYSVKFLI